MYGATYDWVNHDYGRNFYAIKVNKDGLLLSADNSKPGIIKDAIVYPNPGSDHLIIESGPQISGSQFQMSTIDGKQVMTSVLTERKLTLNTQSLKPGVYIWQIIFNGKPIESGKWVKES